MPLIVNVAKVTLLSQMSWLEHVNGDWQSHLSQMEYVTSGATLLQMSLTVHVT